jgi:hypothetical protein
VHGCKESTATCLAVGQKQHAGMLVHIPSFASLMDGRLTFALNLFAPQSNQSSVSLKPSVRSAPERDSFLGRFDSCWGGLGDTKLFEDKQASPSRETDEFPLSKLEEETLLSTFMPTPPRLISIPSSPRPETPSSSLSCPTVVLAPRIWSANSMTSLDTFLCTDGSFERHHDNPYNLLSSPLRVPP